MKTIEYCEGCMSWGTYIDDKPVGNYNIEELKKITHSLIDKINEDTPNKEYIFQEILSVIARETGEYVNLGVCECCGDTIEKYVIYVSDKKK